MKKKLLFVQNALLCLVLTSSIFSTHGQSVTRLVGASPFQDSLWVFDTTSMGVVRWMAPTPSSGGAITGINAIAKHPVTGVLYVVAKQAATVGRTLGTLNLMTGNVNILGNLGDNFATLTFNGNNTLLGVTGDGATTPETLYRINIANANKTLVAALGMGDDGEVICYNPTDNMIYHWSGNTTVFMEKFDTSATTFTPIPISGTPSGETFGMVHVSGNLFIGSNINESFNHWTAGGAVGPDYGTAPDDIRGTALITCGRAITGTPSFCTGDSTLLTMSSGGTSYQWYRNGVAVSGATGQTHYAAVAGLYNCLITDECSYSSGDSLATGVNVQEFPFPVVTVSGNAGFCDGDSALLTGTSGGTSQWYMDGSPISGATNDTYYATLAGNYNMTQTTVNGCTDSAAAGINVMAYPLPTVSLNAQSTTTCVNWNTNVLTGNPSGGTYSGPGVSGNNFDPSAAGAGTHTVMYTYTDSLGCTNADSIQIVVDLCTGISNMASANGITFANPFSNVLYLDLGDDFAGGTVTILNTMGQQVLSEYTSLPRTEINTSSLSQGVYFITVTSATRILVYKGLRQ